MTSPSHFSRPPHRPIWPRRDRVLKVHDGLDSGDRIGASCVSKGLVLALIVMLTSVTLGKESRASEAKLQRGEAIYQQQCVACHGSRGQGVEDFYPDALVGDASVGELTAIISETMPEEDPEACVSADAAAVAEYIHHSFYSEAARLRNRPPRISLARLTGNQLRQSLADLYGHYGGVPAQLDDRGVKGIYFTGSRWDKKKIRIERLDPVLDFDFGRDGPGEGIDPKDFYIYWEGGLKIDRTGVYEIIVRSTVSFVMDFGSHGRQLIDNHVQSGEKTEFRRQLHLTAGRIYPFKIDFRQRKRKTEQPPARFSLSWVPPSSSEQVIPSRHLRRGWVPPTFSLQAKLPPDDRSYGFDRGVAINRAWDDSTTAAALEFAAIARDELWPRYSRKRKKIPAEGRQRLRTFLADFVAMAWGIPMTERLRKRCIDVPLEAEPDDGEAIKRVVLTSLKSPFFLYPTLHVGKSESRRAADRLALTLFDSKPADPWLLAAADGKLVTEGQIRAAAYRMIDDYRSRAKVRALMHDWLGVSQEIELTKDATEFPDFSPRLAADLRTSLDLFLDHVVWSDRSDFRELVRADWSFTNKRLADFYGSAWKARDDAADDTAKSSQAMMSDSTFTPSVRATEVHAGVLTHPYLMSRLGHHDSSSPIHRGVFLLRHVLGRSLRPPNEAFTFLDQALHPALTTRQRVELQTGSEGCQVCHRKINPLGFTLENYDAVGRHRSFDNNRPVDARGNYTDRTGRRVAFDGVRELSDYLAIGEDSHRAFVQRAFRFLVKQPAAAYGSETTDRLVERFRESEYSMRELFVEIAVIAATPTANSRADAAEVAVSRVEVPQAMIPRRLTSVTRLPPRRRVGRPGSLAENTTP